MINEPIPGAVPEEVIFTDPKALSSHYLSIASSVANGGLSFLERARLEETISNWAVVIAELEIDPKKVALARTVMQSLIEKQIKELQERPLSDQILNLVRRYEQEPQTGGPHIYYAGSLITNKSYPDEEKGYKELDTKETIAATPQERKSGLFIKVYKNDKGDIVVRPILEKQMFWPRFRHWTAQIELPRSFYPDGISTEGYTKADDFLTPAHLLRGDFYPAERRLNSKGNWDTRVEIEADTLNVRNFERWARSYTQCSSFQITRKK